MMINKINRKLLNMLTTMMLSYHALLTKLKKTGNTFRIEDIHFKFKKITVQKSNK